MENLNQQLAEIRNKATDVVTKEMGERNYLHFKLMKVSWLKSVGSNPLQCNYTTKGNLELWSTDSLCELAEFILGPTKQT